MSKREMTPNEQREYSEFVIKLGIGQIALVKMWLNKYNLPFKDEDISYTFAESGYLESFTIILDSQAMIEEYAIMKGNPPGNLEKGQIKVVFEY
ncbi:MAG: hypothetical protein K0B08_11515 [Bacteroidales bacterium]|nr:hypothetical protein [Bacteroidales bacterium]